MHYISECNERWERETYNNVMTFVMLWINCNAIGMSCQQFFNTLGYSQ